MMFVSKSLLRSLKLELQSSIYQGGYPTVRDCHLVNRFLCCPLSLEDKYACVDMADVLVGIQ